MRISMNEISRSEILAGALNGRMALNQLLQLAESEPTAPEPIFLDFQKIVVATASYLRECVIGFRDAIRGRDSFYYPMVANPNEAVRDELFEIARTRGDVFMTCALAENGAVSQPALTGDLEAKQFLTFKLVQEHGETDAGMLMREHGQHEKVRHTTAWNNRLSSLAALGLIVETRHGRLKRYRPLFRGA